jgi:hypothetical protein
MKRNVYVGLTLAAIGGLGLAQHPDIMKDIEKIVHSHWGLISAILLSSFIWKFLLRRVIHTSSMNFQNSKTRK